MSAMPNPAKRNSPNFFRRQADGTVRVRLKWSDDEATLIEEAAGTTPLLAWLHKTINEAAERDVREARAQRHIAPPKEQA